MSIDLRTKWLGLDLKSPLVVAPSPLCDKLDNLKRMEDAGASAIVLHSLFEEQINAENRDLDRALTGGSDSFAEALSYFPDPLQLSLPRDRYMDLLRKAAESLSIPVLGSLNGVSSGGWISIAREMEEAGAAALELNSYFIPTDSTVPPEDIDKQYLYLAREVRSCVRLPFSVKLSPYFSSFANLASRLEKEGVQGLTLFNRFYQPDFDLEELDISPSLNLSSPVELRLRLRWAAILHGRVPMQLALTGGVHSGEDVVKCLLAGATVTQCASALLQNGIGHLQEIRTRLLRWMEEKEYESVSQMRGAMSQKSVANPNAFERANYLKVLSSYSLD